MSLVEMARIDEPNPQCGECGKMTNQLEVWREPIKLDITRLMLQGPDAPIDFHADTIEIDVCWSCIDRLRGKA